MIVFLHPAINMFETFSIIALQLSRESYLVFPDSTTILIRPQYPNALLPMLVTEFGMVTLPRPERKNADLPMLVTEFGMVTLPRLQSSNANWPMFVTEFGMTMLVRV